MRPEMCVGLLSAVVLLHPAVSCAQEVYRGVSKSGAPLYTSQPNSSADTPARLPKITKGSYQIARSVPPSCIDHGGVNCQEGADADGSVICYDGFRGALLRFNQHCSEAKLELVEVTEPDDEGTMKVIVRNTRSAEALATRVELRRSRGERLALTGPETVPPYQMAEYSLAFGSLTDKRRIPGQTDFDVRCLNCP
jgi:hypothetical protein